jgi:hypothetical protein
VTSRINERFEAFLGGGLSPEAFLDELSTICRESPDSTWDILALLDQYHRRRRLSADLLREFRRQLEFNALGIGNPGDVHGMPLARETSAPAPAANAVVEELDRLKAELASERRRSQRYHQRIVTLARYGRRQRIPGTSHAVVVMPHTTHATHMAHKARAALVSRVAPVWISGRELVATWLPRRRRFQLPHVGSAAVVLLTATTIIASSTSNLGFAPNLIAATSALISAGPVPELQVSAIPEPPTISLASDRFLVPPGNSIATINVYRAGGGNGPVQFKWWTRSAGAKAGKDFAIGGARMAKIGAGEDFVQLKVRILSNPQRTHTELFYVEIGEPDSNASIGEIRRAPVFIMRSGLGS